MHLLRKVHPTLVSAAILWASSASTSGKVSALRIVCCSFCSASSRRSCSCLFFSSIWDPEKVQSKINKIKGQSRKVVQIEGWWGKGDGFWGTPERWNRWMPIRNAILDETTGLGPFHIFSRVAAPVFIHCSLARSKAVAHGILQGVAPDLCHDLLHKQTRALVKMTWDFPGVMLVLCWAHAMTHNGGVCVQRLRDRRLLSDSSSPLVFYQREVGETAEYL